VKYADDFDRALIAAVNHRGDSDSTGAITGNILGALLGLDGIPQKYIENLELLDVITQIGEDLACCRNFYSRNAAGADGTWCEKYMGRFWING
jgi:ADP-ribosylglycohydrolase